MSTVWCEATFNARVLEKEVLEPDGVGEGGGGSGGGQRKGKGREAAKDGKREDGADEPVVEYLFSLRPIRDGEMAPEELRLTVKEVRES